MHIKVIKSQMRRDFQATYECGWCGDTYDANGYDDSNFHQNVIPHMKCSKCGRVEGSSYRPLSTKYPDNMSV